MPRQLTRLSVVDWIFLIRRRSVHRSATGRALGTFLGGTPALDTRCLELVSSKILISFRRR